MKPDLQCHLSDEALDDFLIGIGSVASHAHLAQCPQCRVRVDSFQSSIDLFNQASIAYSEAQPARTLPQQLPVSRRSFIHRPVFAVWVAAAALLVLAAPGAWRLIVPHPVHAPAVASDAQDSDTQIAEDNELLRQINAAIAPDDQNVIDQYYLQGGLNSPAHSNTRTE